MKAIKDLLLTDGGMVAGNCGFMVYIYIVYSLIQIFVLEYYICDRVSRPSF